MVPSSRFTSLVKPDRRRVLTVCKRLAAEYPNTRLGNKANPLNEYLYIMLSLRTHGPGLLASYRCFKQAFPSWSSAATASTKQIATVIATGGLARQKASRIKDALTRIRGHFGEVSLRGLSEMPQAQVEQFLLGLPGIGIKSAKCIMMYSLGFDVLPVDVHVARISRRLGWVNTGSTIKLHQLLEELIPPRKRFAFHVNCIQHGRTVCRGQNPRCDTCCLSKHCPKIGVRKSPNTPAR